MNAEKCRVLIRAIQLGSMSAASNDLGYTPSGVSYIIDAVESELGFKVINRSSTGITLTQAGVKILPYLTRFVKTEQELIKVAGTLSKSTSGEVTLGTFPSIGRLFMPDIIQEFHAAYPDISVNIVEGINEQLEQLLLSHKVDFCLCSAQLKGFEWYPLMEDPLVCVLPKDHPLTKKDAVTADDIRNEKFIMTAYGRDSDILDLLRKLDLEPEVASYTLENSSAYAMVKRNMGITIVNELATIDQTPDVCIRPFSPPQFITEGILIASLKEAAPATRLFAEFVLPRIPRHIPGKE